MPPDSERPQKPLFSPQLIGRVRRIEEAMHARRDEDQSLAFTPRDFVFFGLPYKSLKGSSTYERRNGRLRLRVVSDPAYGVPYGQDRLLPIWLATVFNFWGQPADGVLPFRAVRDILDAFEQPVSGQAFAALKQRILRFTHTTFFLHDERQSESPSERVRVRRYSLIQEVDLWFERSSHVNQHTLWQNRIILSPEFVESIRSSALPIDLETVKALKESPLALDLYLWQAHRSYELHRDHLPMVAVPVFGEAGLLAQLGSTVKSPRKAKQQLGRCQDFISRVWSSCPNRLIANGTRFLLRPAEAVRQARIALPGFSEAPSFLRLQAKAPGASPSSEGAERLTARARPQEA